MIDLKYHRMNTKTGYEDYKSVCTSANMQKFCKRNYDRLQSNYQERLIIFKKKQVIIWPRFFSLTKLSTLFQSNIVEQGARSKEQGARRRLKKAIFINDSQIRFTCHRRTLLKTTIWRQKIHILTPLLVEQNKCLKHSNKKVETSSRTISFNVKYY